MADTSSGGKAKVVIEALRERSTTEEMARKWEIVQTKHLLF